MNSTTDFDEITVYGARGTTLMILRMMDEYWQGRVKVRALVDDIENGFTHPDLNIPVLSAAERLKCYPELPVLITPGDGGVRAKIAARLEAEGATLATATCAGLPYVDPVVQYGAGSLCASFTRVGPNVEFGVGAQVLATLVAHDVKIGEFSTLGIHSSVLGHVIIGRGVNIAPNAIISNGTMDRPIRIGDGAIIGVGATVFRDVAQSAHVMGNPAMPVKRWLELNRLLDDQ